MDYLGTKLLWYPRSLGLYQHIPMAIIAMGVFGVCRIFQKERSEAGVCRWTGDNFVGFFEVM